MENLYISIMPKSKKFYESKTFWVNVAAILGGFLTFLVGEVQAGTTITAVGLINLFLRFITTQEITL